MTVQGHAVELGPLADARAQLREAVTVLGYDDGLFDMLAAPRREVTVSIPLRRDDGSVEAIFEGEPDMVEHMIWFVRNGPGRSDVSRVDVDEEEPEDLRGFKMT